MSIHHVKVGIVYGGTELALNGPPFLALYAVIRSCWGRRLLWSLVCFTNLSFTPERTPVLMSTRRRADTDICQHGVYQHRGRRCSFINTGGLLSSVMPVPVNLPVVPVNDWCQYSASAIQELSLKSIYFSSLLLESDVQKVQQWYYKDSVLVSMAACKTICSTCWKVQNSLNR